VINPIPTWPRDPHGYIFLARAFDSVGAAQFKGNWSGKEQFAQLVPPLPNLIQSSSSDAYRLARNLLMIHTSEYGARLKTLRLAKNAATVTMARHASRSVGGVSRNCGPLPSPHEVQEAERILKQTEDLTTQEWGRALVILEKQNTESKPLLDRAASVKSHMLSLLEGGELRSAYRAKPGGEMRPIPSFWWNTEAALERFRTYDIDPNAPYANRKGSCWIFILRKALIPSRTSFRTDLT